MKIYATFYWGSMSERFIKFIPSEESSWLLINYPLAFLLLTEIAKRARRQNGHPDGLIIGDAIIGANDLIPAISRQNFRTALDKLVEFKYVRIISNGKEFFEREKSTIKVTIKSHLLNLCSTAIYDINGEDGNQHFNHRPTNSQPTANHKQEGLIDYIDNMIDMNIAQTSNVHRKNDLTDSAFPKTEVFGMQYVEKNLQHNLYYQNGNNLIQVIEGVLLSKDDFEKCIKIKGSLEEVKKSVIDILNSPYRKNTIRN